MSKAMVGMFASAPVAFAMALFEVPLGPTRSKPEAWWSCM